MQTAFVTIITKEGDIMQVYRSMFLRLSLIFLVILLDISPLYGQSIVPGDDTIKAVDVDLFLRSLMPEVWGRPTVDGYKIGDPQTTVTGIACTWMATMDVIEKAIQNDCNFIVTHEPTFFNHLDKIEPFKNDPNYLKKRALLEKHNIVVYRVHDSWDLYPEYGIQDSWAAQLGFTKIARKFKYSSKNIRGEASLFEVEPVTLGKLAKRVKKKMGLKSVRYLGNPKKEVRTVGLLVGAWGAGFGLMKDLIGVNADVMITGETSEWKIVRYAEAAGLSMIVVGHTNSETAGMRNCATLVRKHFPMVKVVFLDAGDPYGYY